MCTFGVNWILNTEHIVILDPISQIEKPISAISKCVTIFYNHGTRNNINEMDFYGKLTHAHNNDDQTWFGVIGFGITFFTTFSRFPCCLLILIWSWECGKLVCLKVFDHKNPITVTMFKMSEPLILLVTVTDCLSAYCILSMEIAVAIFHLPHHIHHLI